LHKALKVALGEDAIKVTERGTQQALSGAEFGVQGGKCALRYDAGNFCDRGCVEAVFAFEVVVEQSLVDLGRFRDGIGARSC
jgi:hypothetical protein